jgi:alanine racemase
MNGQRLSLNKLYVDRDIVASNYLKLKEFVGPKVECAANIKANAYGLGVMPIMSCLSKAGCNKFFVTNLDEALEVRNSSVTDEVYVINGINSGEEAYFAQNHIIPVLNTQEQFTVYNNYCRKKNKSFEAVLNIDTGINRFGFPVEEAIELVKKGFFDQKANIQFLMSHIACSTKSCVSYNKKQLALMNNLQDIFQKPVSFADSGSIYLGQDYCFDIVRLGIMLYGVSSERFDLKPAISLASPIIQIRKVDKDLFVGHDHSYKIGKDSVLATIPIGYADGMHRSISNKASFYINGHPVTIAGQMSMDFTVLDVTNIPEQDLFLGAEVEILGENSTIEKMAECAGTTCHDILTSLSYRLQRIYI